jgi:hypothetical protein
MATLLEVIHPKTTNSPDNNSFPFVNAGKSNISVEFFGD